VCGGGSSDLLQVVVVEKLYYLSNLYSLSTYI